MAEESISNVRTVRSFSKVYFLLPLLLRLLLLLLLLFLLTSHFEKKKKNQEPYEEFKYHAQVTESYKLGKTQAIALGSFIGLTGFFGYIGLFKEKRGRIWK